MSIKYETPGFWWFFGVILPTLYIWTLPLLSKIGFAEIGYNESIGYSISGYISNSRATGLMASLFFSPSMLMWSSKARKCIDSRAFIIKWLFNNTLYIFQICFGGFLTCTVTWNHLLHTMFVFLFAISGIIHFIIIIKYANKSYWDSICLKFGILTFIGICILTFLGYPFICDYTYWFLECFALTTMIIFTPIEIFTLKNQIPIEVEIKSIYHINSGSSSGSSN